MTRSAEIRSQSAISTPATLDVESKLHLYVTYVRFAPARSYEVDVSLSPWTPSTLILDTLASYGVGGITGESGSDHLESQIIKDEGDSVD